MSAQESKLKETLSKRERLIRGRDPLPPAVAAKVVDFKHKLADIGNYISKSIQEVPHDTGRLIAAWDALKHYQNLACEAMILEIPPKKEDDDK